MAYEFRKHFTLPLSPEKEEVYQRFVKTGKQPFKAGDIIINPYYSESVIEGWRARGRALEVDYYEMLCIIEKVFQHKHRDRGVGFRLVSIYKRTFITNTSLKDILSYQ